MNGLAQQIADAGKRHKYISCHCPACHSFTLATAYLAQAASLAAANERAEKAEKNEREAGVILALGAQQTEEFCRRASAAEAQVAALREGLERYGEHDKECEVARWGDDRKCDCGLDAAKAIR